MNTDTQEVKMNSMEERAGEQAVCDPFSEVVEDFRSGKMVILLDDVHRENEGDITIATEKLTPEAVSFMLKHARGLVCISIPSVVAERLNIPLQVLSNNSPFQTPFTVSVDHIEVSGWGVGAAARTHTMRKLIEDDGRPGDFVSPGHVFPLIANPAGVIGRQGQTEGSHDLARIAGCYPSGVICEILNEDGTVAKGAQLTAFARQHGLKITSVEEILRYRVGHEVLLRIVAQKKLKTDYGIFDTCIFEDDVDQKEHIALVYGDIHGPVAPLVRVHSECLTGDVFGSQRCDCRAQLDLSLRKIVEEGAGMVLYLRQEGRGIGLANKLRAYELQDHGHDTVEANIKLGFAPDLRNFAAAAKMLKHFGVRSVRLLTNNPHKIKEISYFGIDVAERVPVVVPASCYSEAYLRTKREKMGHLI